MNKTFEESYLLEGAFFKKSLQDSSFTFGNTNTINSKGNNYIVILGQHNLQVES